MIILINFQQKDKHNITPLLAAVWEGHVSSVEVLLKLVSIWCTSSTETSKYLMYRYYWN